MATNHEVGSSNLSERATLKKSKSPQELASGGFLVSRGRAGVFEESQPKFVKKSSTSSKVRHSGSLLTIKQAADSLGVSISTVTRWCESGELPAIAKPYGKKTTWLISSQALEMVIQIERTKPEERNSATKQAEKLACRPHCDFIKGWESAMIKGLMTGKPFSPNTSSLYLANIKHFLGQHHKLSTRTMQAALMSVGAHQYAKKARLYESLICFGKYLNRQGILENAFFDEVKHFKPKRNLPAKRLTVSEDALALLLGACTTSMERLLLILPASTGLRASEACALIWDDIDLKKGSLTVRLGKGNKTRRVGLSSLAIDALLKHRNQSEHQTGPVFLNRLGEPMDRHGLRQRIERIGKEAGITVTPHALRRAFVTINANKGRPLQMLQMACGHSDITTTRSYCLTAEQEVIDAMKGWD